MIHSQKHAFAAKIGAPRPIRVGTMMIQSMLSSRLDAPVDRALQRLAGAVLIQALQDASSGPRRYREEALDWITGKSDAEFSFDFCCALLGRSPDDVRLRLRKRNYIPKWDADNDESLCGGFSYRPSEIWGATAC